MKVVLATKNKGKVKEFSQLLAPLGIQLLSLDSYPEIIPGEETGTTFADNAILKAEQITKETGLIAIGDDSGLEVDALDGAPGVHSARFAGVHGDDAANNAKLLEMLAQVPLAKRQARFQCAMAISIPGQETVVVEGTCEGTIAQAARGDQGFGYDPLFVPEGYELTMGELAQGEKNLISHRGKAVAQAVGFLQEVKDGKHEKDWRSK